MKPRRFKADDLAGATVQVAGPEAFHALRVLRIRRGDEVVLFDGRGAEALGVVRTNGRGWFEVEVTERRLASPVQGPSLILAVAAPKGERGDWLVEKCAELGVFSLWPLRLERGCVVPGEPKITRWRRKAVQAAKQAALATTMTVEPPKSLAEAVVSIYRGTRLWLADPGRLHPTLPEALQNIPREEATTCRGVVAVGPEGGFSPNERATIMAAGGEAVRICDPILRVETAAVAVASIWAAWAASRRAASSEPDSRFTGQTGDHSS